MQDGCIRMINILARLFQCPKSLNVMFTQHRYHYDYCADTTVMLIHLST